MQDGNFSVDGLRGLKGVGITQLAVDVMARVAARDATAHVALKGSLVSAMFAAAQSPDPGALEALRPEYRRARVTNEVLADYYIPEVARLLGRAWEDDTATFAQVTIGSARLQAFLREIGGSWSADGTGAAGQSTVLLIVPGREQHSIGAMVVAGWLRRKGISVCLKIAPTPAEIAALLAECRFDAAMISVACIEMLEVCTGLVKTLKQETSNGLRIALGGAVLERGEDVAAVLQVDIVTNDLSKAVEALGLIAKRPAMTVIT